MVEDRQSGQRNGWTLHAVHICARLVGAAVLSAVTAVLTQPEALAGAALAGGMVLLLGWPGRSAVLRGLGAVNAFVVLLWLVVPFSGSGEVLHRIGPAAVHADGVALAFTATLRANAIACLLLGLIVATPLHILSRGMESLRIPEKLCAMLYFCVRYVQDIREMHNRLQTAAALRCFVPGCNRHTWLAVGNMFAMTVVRSLDQAHRVHQAMQLRGYDGSFRRLPLPGMTQWDWLTLATLLGVAAGLAGLECNLLELIRE